MRNVTSLHTLYDELNNLRTGLAELLHQNRPLLARDEALLLRAMEEYQASLLAQTLERAA